MAAKRIERWSVEDRKWLADLPEAERELVLMAVAYFNAQPESLRV